MNMRHESLPATIRYFHGHENEKMRHLGLAYSSYMLVRYKKRGTSKEHLFITVVSGKQSLE